MAVLEEGTGRKKEGLDNQSEPAAARCAGSRALPVAGDPVPSDCEGFPEVNIGATDREMPISIKPELSQTVLILALIRMGKGYHLVALVASGSSLHSAPLQRSRLSPRQHADGKL
ncbi:hypothetical protein EMIHUDRAFT_223615 [Emiliania huxleyi CCMP1516]|uniref:Uncharacterized protein n=2 Tax=Emiliania huxleyi TaxID=2903 RepID=A0A0D3KUG1_EMIH1|nr:hypothetical protein EMIHUDRAFT_223615 [Emiliania huxleyi CCMP1516]EOD39396.1 hypothetical protein EMIHUDRAFT_223615 [Emiliania huxleyi CCMP1516]|eukprot:XP_005791825.1 hypothetical protein EMIHUDRAFT_223615 [Emiliania huxleyi CCMP1516]